MKRPALIFASIAVACVVGIAAYSKGREPGADIRIHKTEVFAKDQSRLCPFDAADFTGCER